MTLVIAALIVLAAVACLVSPTAGLVAYIATVIVRPNELFDDIPLPAIPIMIVAMSLGYMIHLGRGLPRTTGGPRSKTPLLMVLMILLLVVHLLLKRTDQLIDWILSEGAPSLLILFFVIKHFTTPARLETALTATTLSSAFIVLEALHVHFFRMGAPRKTESSEGVPYITYGKEWDLYHLEGQRLQGRATSIWGNANEFGMVCNWVILGCLYYFRRKGPKLVRIGAVVLTALSAIALFLTGSRGGQLQLGIMLWMIFVGGKRKAVGIVLLLVALVGIVVVLPRFSPERSDSAASKDERTELMMAGVRLFLQRPIQGCGFLGFREENDFKTLMPHNVYVQCLAETGLIGSSIFFSLIFFLRRETSMAVKHFESGRDQRASVLARCIGALQFAFSVYIFFSNQFMRYTFALVMTEAIGLYGAMLRDKEQARERELEAAAEEEEGAGGEAAPLPAARAPARPRPARPEEVVPEILDVPVGRARGESAAPRRQRGGAGSVPERAPEEAAGPELGSVEVFDHERSRTKYVFDPEDRERGVVERERGWSWEDAEGARPEPRSPRGGRGQRRG